MLLRELTVEGHVLSLNDKNGLYIVEIKNSDGEKLFYHEYTDYEEIRELFDIVVEGYEDDNISIKKILDILESSK